MLKELYPLLHSELRLAIMSILLNVEKADFTYLLETCHATSGNLSIQLNKLQQAEYIHIKKEFVGKRPQTMCFITKKGELALEQYVENLRSYLNI